LSLPAGTARRVGTVQLPSRLCSTTASVAHMAFHLQQASSPTKKMPEAPNMLLLVGATADSCVLCVLCRVFMIRTAALVKICWEVLPAERYSLQKKNCREVLPVAATARSIVPSSHCDAATSPGRATARRVGPHCAREGVCPCLRLASKSEPTQGRSLYHQSSRSISGPCSPSPPR
jgi:hypothetical protein